MNICKMIALKHMKQFIHYTYVLPLAFVGHNTLVITQLNVLNEHYYSDLN